VARGFEEVLARALSASPNDRFESADELLTELSYLRDAGRAMATRSSMRPWRPSLAPPVTPPASGKRWELRLRPSTLHLTLAALLALGVGAALGVYEAHRGAAQSVPAFEADRCRLVGHRVEGASAGNEQRLLYSISCPASDAPMR
jgi:hypothetical protein